MYRDTAGKMTVGVGLMLPDPSAACALPFLYGAEPASQFQISAEFVRVHALPPGHLPAFYKTPGSPELSQQTIDAKLSSVLTGFETTLRARLPGYNGFPEGVKLALLDMAYNLGPSGLLDGYPHMIHAIETGEWGQAAAQCIRQGIGEERNVWTRRQLLSAVVESIRAEAATRLESEAEAIEASSASWFGRFKRALRRLFGSR